MPEQDGTPTQNQDQAAPQTSDELSEIRATLDEVLKKLATAESASASAQHATSEPRFSTWNILTAGAIAFMGVFGFAAYVLHSDIVSLRSELGEERSARADMLEMLQNSTATQIESQNQLLGARFDDLSNQITNTNDINSSLKDQFRAAEVKLHGQSEEYEATLQKVSATQTELASQFGAMTTLRAELTNAIAEAEERDTARERQAEQVLKAIKSTFNRYCRERALSSMIPAVQLIEDPGLNSEANELLEVIALMDERTVLVGRACERNFIHLPYARNIPRERIEVIHSFAEHMNATVTFPKHGVPHRLQVSGSAVLIYPGTDSEN